LSEGTLLGGRVLYRQSEDGYRTGIEPVLLAAVVPAQPGDHVVEAGTGAGAAVLCLAARVPGITGLGLEIDAAQAALAAANFAANGHQGLGVKVGDIAAWKPEAPADHAFANPPWHADSGTASANAGRRTAKMASATLLEVWAARLAGSLKRRGTLSLIVPASRLSAASGALRQSGCGEISVMPLWPHAGEPAKLLILQAIRQGRGPDRLLPGLVLHKAGGGYTDEAQAVLRDGASLMR
jgi:tRNA1(Val) A37 N6-methylase TrmN6